MKKGFSLIELLVVIAVIGILTAIAFPVFARAKESAYRGSDIANMNAIRTALQLYRADQGAYPPALLGYANLYDGSVPNMNQVIPADRVAGALYPRRIDSLQTLRPALVRPLAGQLEREISTAVWPAALPTGDNTEQRFGPEQVVQRCFYDASTATSSVVDNAYYRISGYDAATVRVPGDPNGSTRHELHYTLFWTRYSVPVDPCNPVAGAGLGSGNDDPRQLGYTDPPETTVVTWNAFFRDYQGDGTVTRTRKDVVLFLNGSAKTVDSARVAAESWQVTP
jgi:prepilin-type N-terminal cleavage/methylation domain-containing protein